MLGALALPSMKHTLRGAILAIAALLGFVLWLRVHDKAVRAEERDAARYRVVEDSARITDSLARVLLQHDSVAIKTIAQLERQVSRVRARVDTVTLPPPRDSIESRRDTIISELRGALAAQDSALVIFRARQTDLETLVSRLTAERQAFRALADAYRKRAQRKLGCTGGASVTVGFTGGSALGAGVTCGVRL